MARLIIMGLVIICCIYGFYFNFKRAILNYNLIHNGLLDETSFSGFANYAYVKLKDSETINKIKELVSLDSTIGFYSNLPYGYEHMMYSVLQNLLAPVLLDRGDSQYHKHTIMFLDDKDQDSIDFIYNRKVFEDLDCNLYIVSK